MPIRNSAAWLFGAGIAAFGLGAAATLPRLRDAHITHPHTGQPLTVPGKDNDATLLFNGWKITPAGRPASPQEIFCSAEPSVPTASPRHLQRGLCQTRAAHRGHRDAKKKSPTCPFAHTWNGIAWSPDGSKIYVGGGVSTAGNDIYTFEKTDANGGNLGRRQNRSN